MLDFNHFTVCHTVKEQQIREKKQHNNGNNNQDRSSFNCYRQRDEEKNFFFEVDTLTVVSFV